MRTFIAWTLTLAVGAGAARSASAQGRPPGPQPRPAAAAAKAPPKPAAPADPAAIKARQDAEIKAREEMNLLLDEWEKQSKKVTSLYVIFDRIDRSQGWGDQYYRGQAKLQSPDLACLEFQKYKTDAKGKPIAQLEDEPFERIVCTGNEVLQYSWDDRKMFVFPLDKQVRQKALQQGPLPFLFNMKAADARRRYSMTLLNQVEKEYLIGIVPQEEIDKQSFSKALLWLSKETFLPNMIRLIPVGDKVNTDYQEFRFVGNKNSIKANVAIDKSFFAYNRIPDWKEIVNPGADDASAPAPAAKKAADRPTAQPAMRNATRPK